MTKKEFLAIPKREWNNVLREVWGVYVIPNGRTYKSGWGCMDFVAEFKDGREMVRFGGICDDVSFCGSHFRMDCLYPGGIIHIWSWSTFSVSCDVSRINFIEDR